MKWFTTFLLALIAASVTASATDRAYRPPRLENGRPDLQGIWEHTDSTPLVRPAEIKTLVITSQQAKEIERTVAELLEDPNTPNDPVVDFTARHIKPIRGELRSSVIINPDDGAIPATSLFKNWVAKVRFNILNAMEGPEQRPTSERCLGNPAAQPPNLYNVGTNLHQIVQTKDTIVFAAEWNHDARIIRLNATHAPAALASWLGDSIGWWEGDTLVVETKYFSPSDSGRVVPFINFLVSPQATVTERFTRVSDVELNYVFTIDDPIYYTQPWTGETHFFRSGDRIFEYSCHEGNYSLTFNLEAARARDAIK